MKLLPVLIMVLCIKQLNAQNTIPQITLEGHQYTVFCIDFFDDNMRLGSGGWDNTVKIWDFKNSKEVRSFNYHEDMIRDVCFSPDNTMIASASRDNTIKVTNLSNGEKTIITNQYEPTIEDYYRNTYFSSIAFTPHSDKLLFTLAGRNEIFFRDIERNSLSEKIPGPVSGIRKLELSNDGQFVAGISGDNTVIIWDMITKKEIAELKDHIGQLAWLRSDD